MPIKKMNLFLFDQRVWITDIHPVFVDQPHSYMCRIKASILANALFTSVIIYLIEFELASPRTYPRGDLANLPVLKSCVYTYNLKEIHFLSHHKH